jgi:DNA topoisomerase-1
MAKSLVIVESPTKAKTIRKFLPSNFDVLASMGHVRDLPNSATEIPAKYKGEAWTRLGVNVEKDFEPLYVTPKGKGKILTELKQKLKDADIVYLATDEDREGESIAWHLVTALKPKVPVKRMVFHEITKSAITHALEDTRDLNEKLISAQETRRVLDRLYGYTLSPLLWKKIGSGLSAGRVQSVALKLIVDRERERSRFIKSTFWDLLATLAKDKSTFDARLISVNDQRIASGKDFDESTGKLAEGKENLLLMVEEDAEKLRQRLEKETWKIQKITAKEQFRNPQVPFITSTLQQEAVNKLNMSARDAMRVAQILYERGFITYMRTDSPTLSQEAIDAARTWVKNQYGDDYLSPQPRQFSASQRGAQEAHEAIRPAGAAFVHPRDTGLDGRELALYQLIWSRTVASQMAPARKEMTTVQIAASDALFSASGVRILFPGYLRAYVEGTDDPDSALEDKEVLLPEIREGEILPLQKLISESHETKPPARFTEATLVRALEKAGVGRPSTYATIIGTIVERGYVFKDKRALIPTFTGFAVTQLLERHFERLVDLNFTAKMEESLDEIAVGDQESLPYLKKFYLGKEGLQEQVKKGEDEIDLDESHVVDIPHLEGKDWQVRVGRFGAYVVNQKSEDNSERASLPSEVPPADLRLDTIAELVENAKQGPVSIGTHPETGEEIFCLTGRYGPYVQLGELTDDNPKPKRASVPRGTSPSDVTLEQAVALLEWPRELGIHPEDKKPVTANQGRFGPYVAHEKNFRSIPKTSDPETINLEEALELLAKPKPARRGRAATAKK